MAIGPIATFVQLYILQLHGSVLDVGLATTLFNAVTIPGSIFWGFVTDRIHTRKTLVVLSYVAVAASIFAFSIIRTIYGVEIVYAAFAFLSVAFATPLNLLIMETQPKSKWASIFARFSMISSVGVTVGLLISAGWADFLPFYLLVIPLGALALASAVLSIRMIKEQAAVFERSMIAMIRESLYQRLLALPMLFLKIPKIIDFLRIFRSAKFGVTREPALIYLSVGAFYFAAGLFNTSLVPSLYLANLSTSQVFLVLLAGMVIQVIAFNYLGKRIQQKGVRRTAVQGLLLRGASYLAMGIAVVFWVGLPYLGVSLVFYPLGAGIAYAAYYAASNVMIFNTLGRSNQGSSLGVFSALVGMATMLGSFVSGLISFYVGYYATFIAAAVWLGLGAMLTSVIGDEVENKEQ
jgi:MFS family permease